MKNIKAQESLIVESREYDFKKMLKRYLQDEELKGDNKYECEYCEKKSNLTIKKSKWRRMPPIMIVTANRFSYKNGIRNKVLHKMTIVENLSISELFSKENFDLNNQETSSPVEENKDNSYNLDQAIKDNINYGDRDPIDVEQEEGPIIVEKEIKKEKDNINNGYKDSIEVEHQEEEEKDPITKKTINNEYQDNNPIEVEHIEEKEHIIINKKLQNENNTILIEDTENIYSLYCMIIHKGPSIEHGHYFAFVKDLQDNAWFLVDDLKQMIERVDLDYEFSQDETPYIFYYLQKNK